MNDGRREGLAPRPLTDGGSDVDIRKSTQRGPRSSEKNTARAFTAVQRCYWSVSTSAFHCTKTCY